MGIDESEELREKRLLNRLDPTPDPSWTAVETALRQFRTPNPNPEKDPAIREAEAKERLSRDGYWPHKAYIPPTWGLQDAAQEARTHGAEPKFDKKGEGTIQTGWTGGAERVYRASVRVKTRTGGSKVVQQGGAEIVYPASDAGANVGEHAPHTAVVTREYVAFLSTGKQVVHSEAIIGAAREPAKLPPAEFLIRDDDGLLMDRLRAEFLPPAEREKALAKQAKPKGMVGGYPGLTRALEIYQNGAPIVGYVGKKPKAEKPKAEKKASAIPRAPKAPPTAEEIAAKAERDAKRAKSAAETAKHAADNEKRYKTARAEIRAVASQGLPSLRIVKDGKIVDVSSVERVRAAEKRAAEASITRIGDRPVASGSIKGIVALNDLELYLLKKGERPKAAIAVKDVPRKADKAAGGMVW